ncbi:BES15S03c [Trypanosoma theileri]|uniref:BES15S03c n=1 Tax=Trypanosoma theileri TaxID=67003 RepID=A0A1X0NFW5_9TRYP|nr:BES15S03c [Trypanosoma theileri]ORC83547.1 BES15S03c [Trypanosoma theileri]
MRRPSHAEGFWRAAFFEGFKGPTTFFFLKTRWPFGYGVTQQRDQPRRGEAKIYPRRSWGTCRRAISSETFTRLLLSGDGVEENPGPSLRGMQWNSAGLTQAKRLVLQKNPS